MPGRSGWLGWPHACWMAVYPSWCRLAPALSRCMLPNAPCKPGEPPCLLHRQLLLTFLPAGGKPRGWTGSRLRLGASPFPPPSNSSSRAGWTCAAPSCCGRGSSRRRRRRRWRRGWAWARCGAPMGWLQAPATVPASSGSLRAPVYFEDCKQSCDCPVFYFSLLLSSPTLPQVGGAHWLSEEQPTSVDVAAAEQSGGRTEGAICCQVTYTGGAWAGLFSDGLAGLCLGTG